MKLNKGITLTSIVITITILLIIAGVVISLVMYNKEINQQENTISKAQEECEHDWVITSKYDYFRKSYKTISKCSKCGKEIE